MQNSESYLKKTNSLFLAFFRLIIKSLLSDTYPIPPLDALIVSPCFYISFCIIDIYSLFFFFISSASAFVYYSCFNW